MKKIISFTLIILATLFLYSCISNDGAINKVLNEIDIEFELGESTNNIKSNFNLPTQVRTYDLSWSSSNINIISIVNNKAIVTRNEIDETVILTASLTIKEKEYTKNFTLIVIKLVDEEPVVYHKVVFYLNKDDVNFYKEVEVKNNTIIKKFANPVKDGYTFEGWYNILNDQIINLDLAIKSDLNLYAKWHENSNTNNRYGFHELNLYYLNDTHGAVLEYYDPNGASHIGLSKISNLVKSSDEQERLFIGGGDMFQGELISNDNKGSLMIDIFNEMKMDAMVLGNHEFDWGIEEILKYFNSNPNDTKANFKLLGSNVIDKRTGERPEGIEPYTIVNKNGVNIGIVGAIGDTLETSISYNRVKDYEFTNSYSAVSKYVYEIQDQVDYIIVGIHDDNDIFNRQVSLLPKVRSILNAHRHFESINSVNGVPIIQSGTKGRYVGNINLKYNIDTSEILTMDNPEVKNYTSYDNYKLNNDDEVVKNIIDNYYNSISHLYEDVIITSDESMDQDTLALFIARLMKETTHAQLGLQNSGGTRATISNNQRLTAADIFRVVPFDNRVVYTEIKGSYFKKLSTNQGFFKSINDISVKDNEYYRVATNDYSFDSTRNQFRENQLDEETYVGDLFEIFVELLMELSLIGYNYFNSRVPIVTFKDSSLSYNSYLYFENENILQYIN